MKDGFQISSPLQKKLPRRWDLQTEYPVLSLAIGSVAKCNALLSPAPKSPVLWWTLPSPWKGKSTTQRALSSLALPLDQGAEPFGRIGVEELSVQVVCDATTVLSLRHHVLNSDLKWRVPADRLLGIRKRPGRLAPWIWIGIPIFWGSGPLTCDSYSVQVPKRLVVPPRWWWTRAFPRRANLSQGRYRYRWFGAPWQETPKVGLIPFDNQGYSHPDPDPETEIF